MPYPRRPTTMKDVAEHAGVSMATVSRALSGNRPMSSDLRDRVVEVAEELGYSINLLGRGLRQKRTSSVGLIVPDLDNPFFSGLAQAVSRAFAPSRTDLFVLSADTDIGQELRGVRSFLDRQVDALIIIPCDEAASSEAVAEAANRAMTVQLDRQTTHPAHFVGCDNRAGMALVAEHLRRLGKDATAPVYIGGSATSSSENERREGFLQHFPSATVLEGSFSVEWGSEAAKELIKSGLKHSTVVTGADVIAVGLMSELLTHGVSIPGQVRVIGFDDIGVSALARPRLTTVRQPVEAMTRRIASLTIGSRRHSAPARVLFKPDLVARDSSPDV